MELQLSSQAAHAWNRSVRVFQSHSLRHLLSDFVSKVWVLALLSAFAANSLVLAQTSTTDLAITATPDPVKPGEKVLYTVTFTNRTANLVNGWFVTATVPNHTTVAAGERSSGYCVGNATCNAGATIQWTFDNVAAGQSVSVTFAALVDTVDPPSNGTLLHSVATVNSNAGGGASATSDVVVNAAPVAPAVTLSSGSLTFGSTTVGANS